MSLRDVLIDELRDLYSAENQLIKALPKVAKATSDAQLKTIFAEHLEETKNHVQRLKLVFEHIGKKATGEHCNGMEGLLKEGKDAIEKDEEGATKDVCLAGAALRIEHYEIAGYSAAIAIAKTLNKSEIVALLTATLNEELTASKKVEAQTKPILAKSAADGVEEEKDDTPKTAKEKESDRKIKADPAGASKSLKKFSSK